MNFGLSWPKISASSCDGQLVTFTRASSVAANLIKNELPTGIMRHHNDNDVVGNFKTSVLFVYLDVMFSALVNPFRLKYPLRLVMLCKVKFFSVSMMLGTIAVMRSVDWEMFLNDS